jgi:outer membrane protein TolC
MHEAQQDSGILDPRTRSPMNQSHQQPDAARLAPGRGVRLMALLGLLLAGCSTYHPQPLDSAAVNSALRPPDAPPVRIAADKIGNPLLRPLVIDGRDGFTPDEIAVMTVIASPQLRALRDQRGVARSQLLQAGILPNPQFGFTFDQLHGSNAATLDPTLENGRGLGLTWEVTSLLVRGDNVAAARATADALDLSIAWQEWQAAQDARLRAFRVISLEQRLPLARASEDDLAETVKLIQQAMALGQKTASDLTTATAEWTQAQAERLAVDQQLNADRTALDVALGQPADTPLRLKPGPVDFFSATQSDASRLLEGLEKRRLDLVALRLGYESGEASLRAAVKAQFPKIGLSFGKSNDTSDVRTRNYGVTVDLPVFDRNQGQIAIGRATRQQLFDEYVARVAEARAEVAQGLADLEGVRLQLQSVAGSLPALEQLATSLDKAFQSGNADVLTAREARGALAARRIERSRLEQSLVELEIALEFATGRPLLDRDRRP